MRNIFQTQIDATAKLGSKKALTSLHIFIAEFTRSLNDAILEAPADGDRQQALGAIKTEVNEALKQIDKLCGWA